MSATGEQQEQQTLIDSCVANYLAKKLKNPLNVKHDLDQMLDNIEATTQAVHDFHVQHNARQLWSVSTQTQAMVDAAIRDQRPSLEQHVAKFLTTPAASFYVLG